MSDTLSCQSVVVVVPSEEAAIDDKHLASDPSGNAPSRGAVQVGDVAGLPQRVRRQHSGAVGSGSKSSERSLVPDVHVRMADVDGWA